jgi:hypothetical protein
MDDVAVDHTVQLMGDNSHEVCKKPKVKLYNTCKRTCIQDTSTSWNNVFAVTVTCNTIVHIVLHVHVCMHCVTYYLVSRYSDHILHIQSYMPVYNHWSLWHIEYRILLHITRWTVLRSQQTHGNSLKLATDIRDHFEVVTRHACLAPVPVRRSHWTG